MKRKYISLEKRLKERRGECRLASSFVADQIGVDRSFWSKVEAGRALLPVKHFRKASQLLGIPLRDMIDYRCRDERYALIRTVRLS